MNAAVPFPDSLADDSLYPRLKEQLLAFTGLTYYADKDAELVRRVGRRLANLGLRNCASYLEVLRDPLRGPAELDALIAEITIGETYFFRHREHFDALRDLVLPSLITRNRASRSLRIWCAGCANGAEPYSLAVLLKREMAHQLAGWEVTILGTDINRCLLAIAREGRFEEWAFRTTPEEMKRACFRQEGSLWSIRPEYQERVSFQYHNLVENPFPSLFNNLCAFDLIVCRNVMIYFGPDTTRNMIRQFHECLVPGGWLLVGPAEPNMTSFTSFRTVNAPGVTLYQKTEQFARAAETGVLPAASLALPVVPAAAPTEMSPAVQVVIPSIPPTLADVRRHADLGEWDHAIHCCERLLETGNLNPTVHFYHALVLEQMGKHAEAERSLRRAIYLDRQSVLAHYYLGLLLQFRGGSREAARSFENALRLLDSRPAGEVFADADGVTAAELKKLAKMQLETLQERV